MMVFGGHKELWGKAMPSDTAGPTWHPLVFHMLDVAACAERLLHDVRPGRCASLARSIGLSEEHARPWLLLFVVLHDLGKATPPFQRKVKDAVDRLAALGFDFPDADEPHGEMTAVLLPDRLEELGCAHDLAVLVSRSVGAHHGSFVTSNHFLNVQDNAQLRGKSPAWADARRELVADLARIFGGMGSPSLGRNRSERHAFAADLAGLTTTADWIGSNSDYFPYRPNTISLASYWTSARQQAVIALDETGFRRPPRAPRRTFIDLFKRSPWPLHDAMAEILPRLGSGALAIVEAPMGEGKTEAALLAYDYLSSSAVDGLYFALPTQATANQILGRVARYLEESFPEAHGLHLVHGGAALSDRYDKLKESAYRQFRARSVDGVADTRDSGPVADAWFTRSKKALLAPIGVGTVDQALLAVLRSKHHFLRLHGLAGKVFVVDEVHAYDTFTSEILSRLVEWLRALGGTVILLSATLSSPHRARLLAAAGVEQPVKVAEYPRITIARDGVAEIVPFASRRAAVRVEVQWHDRHTLVERVRQVLRRGGNVAWIVNTVRRAQSLYLEMRARVADDLRLLHARLPVIDRIGRERSAEEAFGPPGVGKGRPARALLIGTQVLEQSLDLDFDLMVTELAPVDLILQRAGRLHRHDRASRPPGLEARQLWIELPEMSADERGPEFGVSSYVYDEEILLRSYLTLRSRASLSIPTDIEPLVEAVYAPQETSDLPPAILARLRVTAEERENARAGDRYSAINRTLPPPSHDAPFGAFDCFGFDDEDPSVHKALRAVTRLGEESVTVVPVVERGARVALATDPAIEFDPNSPEGLTREVGRARAWASIAISRRSIVRELVRTDAPPVFQRSGFVRYHRLLKLTSELRATVGGVELRLDPELGLVVGNLDPEQKRSAESKGNRQ